MPIVFCLMVVFLLVLVMATWPRSVNELPPPLTDEWRRRELALAKAGPFVEWSGRPVAPNQTSAPLFFMIGSAPEAQKKPQVVQEVDASIPPRLLDRRKQSPE